MKILNYRTDPFSNLSITDLLGYTVLESSIFFFNERHKEQKYEPSKKFISPYSNINMCYMLSDCGLWVCSPAR